MVADAGGFPWLDPPFEWVALGPGRSFLLRMVRFEMGLGARPIREPPGQVVRPVLRIHVPPADKPYRAPWWDWTTLGLFHRLAQLHEDLIAAAFDKPADQLIADLEALSPARPRPLSLRIYRNTDPDDVEYGVQVV